MLQCFSRVRAFGVVARRRLPTAKANTSFQFSFSLRNPLDSNPTSSFTNFKYSLDDVSVAGTPDSITFYTVSSLGLFDLAFGNTILSFYGDDIGSTGFLDFPKAYSFTSAVNGNNSAGGLGFLTVTSAVPEPATWAMMVLGFGAMGMAMRRRRGSRRRFRTRNNPAWCYRTRVIASLWPGI